MSTIAIYAAEAADCMGHHLVDDGGSDAPPAPLIHKLQTYLVYQPIRSFVVEVWAVLHLVPQDFRGVQPLGQDCKQATDRVQLVGVWAYTHTHTLFACS